MEVVLEESLNEFMNKNKIKEEQELEKTIKESLDHFEVVSSLLKIKDN